MKKILIILCIFLVLLTGCSEISKISVSNTKTALIWDASFIADGGKYQTLSSDDSKAVDKLLRYKKWQEGLYDCVNDVKLLNAEQILKYSSDCGAVNDTDKNRSIVLSDNDRQKLNAILKNYGTLGAAKPPVTVYLGEKTVDLAIVSAFGTDWTGTGMVMWDGPFVDDVLPDMVKYDELTKAEYDETLNIELSSCAELIELIVYNENCERINEFNSVQAVNTLAEGTYHIGVFVKEQGRFIAEAGEYVTSSCIYLFTLVKE